MRTDVEKYKFCVVGMGFLGGSIVHVFNLHADIKFYDKYKESDTLEEALKDSEVAWLCLPTPMKLSDGECDLSILEENVEKINELSDPSDKRIVVVKSTVPPGTCRELQGKYSNVTILSCPEFLTARAANINAITPSRIIIGHGPGGEEASDKLKEIFEYRFGKAVNMFVTEWEASELCKYGANCFFAVKISYFNMIWSMCQKLGLDYDEVRDLICSDGRIGISHNNVPGWDGNRGYSGSCFPKDINALEHLTKKLGVNGGLLKASWDQNLEDRPNKDWEDVPSAINKDE